MWKFFFGFLLATVGAKLIRKFENTAQVQRPDLPIVGDKIMSPEKVALAEERVKENFAFVMDCYDQAKKEGQNVLQWLFGAIVGGLGLVGALAKENYWPIAVGAFVAVGWAAYTAAQLVEALKSNDMQAPGNNSKSFRKMAAEGISATRMRWRETMGLSDRAEINVEIVAKIAIGTDRARSGMAFIPVWFLAFTAFAWEVELLVRGLGVLFWRSYQAGYLDRVLDSIGM